MQVTVSSIKLGSRTLSQAQSQLEKRGFSVESYGEDLVINPTSASSFLIKSWGTVFILKKIIIKQVNESLRIIFCINKVVVVGVVVIFVGLMALAQADGSIRQAEFPQALFSLAICLPLMFFVILFSLASSFMRELK